MKVKSKKLNCINVIFLLVVMISLPLLSLIPENTAGEQYVIKEFGDGKDANIVEFPSGGGWNKDAYFEIPNNQTVISASFEIDGMATSKYPANLTLDIGDDGDTDWIFKGDGYGPLGRQILFLDNQTTRTINSAVAFSYDNATKIRIPMNAYVGQAYLKITGESPYPAALTADVNGINIFNHPGVLDNTQLADEFSVSLNTILAGTTEPSFTDRFNNSFVDVTLKVTWQSPGKIKLHNLRISYAYASIVDLNNHNDNLANELTELIPHLNSGTTKIVLAFQSDTAGKLWMKNVNIVHRDRDEPPELKQNIPDLHVDEGTKVKKIDLSTYFYDDRSEVQDLTYEVLNHTETNADVGIVDNTWLEIDATIVPYWYGSFNEIIRVTDSVYNIRESNEFTIHIDPVNDEPTFNKAIQNITVEEDSTSDQIDLSAQDYFTDIENDELYYSMGIDPLHIYSGEALTIDYNSETSIFTVTALSDWYGNDVPIWIYCDDDEEVNILGYLTYVYQEIYVNVTPVNDAPYWSDNVEDLHINEDEDLNNWINLEDYVNDIDNTKDELSYGIILETNPDNIKVAIDTNHYIDVTTLTSDYVGSSTVTIEITDNGYQIIDEFDVIIDPVDDAPIVNLTSHADGAIINGTAKIYGTANDDKDQGAFIERVEVQIRDYSSSIGDWKDAAGTLLWEYYWNTDLYPNGDYQFSARAFDGTLYSNVVTYNFTISKQGGVVDPGKEVSETIIVNINAPEDNSVAKDTITVSGYAAVIDGGTGVNVIEKVYIQFIGESKSPWFEAQGTDSWQYSWNTQDFPNGNYEINVMAISGEFSSRIQTRAVEIDNPTENVTPVDDGNGDTFTTIIDKTGDNIWFLVIFLLVLFIITENIVVSMFLKKRRKEQEKPSDKDERVEPSKEIEEEPKPETKPVKESLIKAAAGSTAIPKDKVAPSLTSEFPLTQTYRPSPEQLEVIPVAPHKTEKPKFKVHFCPHCKKPFKIQLPIKSQEKIMCPWCNKKNFLDEKTLATKPKPAPTSTESKPTPPFKKPAIAAKPLTPTAKPTSTPKPAVKPAIKPPTVVSTAKPQANPKK